MLPMVMAARMCFRIYGSDRNNAKSKRKYNNTSDHYVSPLGLSRPRRKDKKDRAAIDSHRARRQWKLDTFEAL